jgi:hypothetical protein
MPENIDKCPFSKAGCRNCPIYRGRHNYIVHKEGEAPPEAKVLKKVENDNWQANFKEMLGKNDKEISEQRTPKKTKTTKTT